MSSVDASTGWEPEKPQSIARGAGGLNQRYTMSSDQFKLRDSAMKTAIEGSMRRTLLAFKIALKGVSVARCKHLENELQDVLVASRPLTLNLSNLPRHSYCDEMHIFATARRLLQAAIVSSRSMKRLWQSALLSADSDLHLASDISKLRRALVPPRQVNRSDDTDPSPTAEYAAFHDRKFLMDSAVSWLCRLRTESAKTSSRQTELAQAARSSLVLVERLITILDSWSRLSPNLFLSPRSSAPVTEVLCKIKKSQNRLDHAWRALIVSTEALDRSCTVTQSSIHQLISAGQDRL